jgi:hypothetical protein
MRSNIDIILVVLEILALLINGTVLFLVLYRGRKRYHYLFAATIAVYVMICFSGFLFTIRNSHPGELIIYESIFVAFTPFITPCIYHFTCSYLNQSRRKSTIFIWAYAVILSALYVWGMVTGFGPMELTRNDMGAYVYTFQGGPVDHIISLITNVIYLVFMWLACQFLFFARRRETSPLARRHILYILISFLITLFLHLIKFLQFTGLKGSYLTAQIQLVIVAAFGALIGIAIIKERLLDITVVIKKTTIYSLLLALVVIIFSLSEHLLATYVGKFFGEHSFFIHLISIVVVIAVLMPVRQKVERRIERFFEKKKVEF